MPIYAYRCPTCGHAKDVLRKMSDPPLTECPACGAPTFVKQVTAAGFQLKGSGWYVTDFKGGGAAPKADKTEGGGAAAPEGGTSGEAPSEAAKSEPKADGKGDARADTKAEARADMSASKSEAIAAPAAKPAATATPSPGTGTGSK